MRSTTMVSFVVRRYHRDDLVCGYTNGVIQFRHKAFDERSSFQQRKYIALREHLKEHGQIHPIITWQGHILIGMRRFEILREWQEWFDCDEVDDDVSQWDHTNLRQFIKENEHRKRDRGRFVPNF